MQKNVLRVTQKPVREAIDVHIVKYIFVLDVVHIYEKMINSFIAKQLAVHMPNRHFV